RPAPHPNAQPTDAPTPDAPTPDARGADALLTGPGALATGVVEDERAPCLGIRIPDVLAGEIGIPGGGHELEQPAGAAGAIDGQRIVMALAVGNPQRPAQAGAVAKHGVD